MLRKAKEHNEIAIKFRMQLEKIFRQYDFDVELLKERTARGITWFAENFSKDLLRPLYAHIETLKHASKVKLYMKYARELYGYLEMHLKKLFLLRFDEIIFVDENMVGNYLPQKASIKSTVSQKDQKGAKAEKGETYTITLDLFKEHKPIAEIAKLRNLAQSTVEGHLARFVSTGEVSVFELLDEQNVHLIMKAFSTTDENISSVRSKLDNVFSYNQVRAVLNHMLKEKVV
jgi:hypothetical protein